MRVLLGCALIVSLSLAAVAAEPADVLRQADRDFNQATKTNGLEGWLSWFADNASLPQQNPPVHGKAALREFYKGLFSHKDLDFRWSPERAELFPSGTLGYTSGRYTMSFSGADGKRVSRTGSYLTVWEQQADGAWKVLADFGAPDAAPAK